jgi:hypothetical protein
MKTIKLHAGTSSSGRPVFEEVLVADAEASRFQVLRTPGLVLGVARDDEISYDASTCAFKVEKRGGRVAVQLYLAATGHSEVAQLAAQLERAVTGSWDGLSERQAVFSFPAAAGFTAVETLLNEFVNLHPGVEWNYGNVYADDGTTPLNWWCNA